MTRRNARDLLNTALWFASELAENLWRQRQRDSLGITALERTGYELEDRMNDIERDRVKRGGRR